MADPVGVQVNTAALTDDLMRLADSAIKEVSAALLDIVADAEGNAEGKWYTQVNRRTGKTGTALETQLRATQDKLKAVVLSTNKTSYMIKRPAASSVIRPLATKEEYSAAMSAFRKTGQIPTGWEARKRDKSGRPRWLYKSLRNPLASDGKNLWSVLVRKEGKKIVEARASDLEAALQRAADKLR